MSANHPPPDAARERRLEDLRQEAERRGRVSGTARRPPGAPFPQATAANGYYGLPLLKPPVWTWELPVYFFVGGLAGASALVGAVAQWSGNDDRLTRDARWIAALGGVASPLLLASDLGRPERFLNMLRVFKVQSPMSVGAWTLVAFSTSAASAAFAESITRQSDGRVPVRIIGDAAAVLSAATGLEWTSSIFCAAVGIGLPTFGS